MKKVFLLGLLILTAISCSLDDDGVNYRFEAVPVSDVTLPDTLTFGERYEFPIRYERPNSCYGFEGFDYDRKDSLRYVFVVNRAFEGTNCDTVSTPGEALLNFEVLYTYTYVFNFYQGDDENGEPIYLTKEIPVKEED